MFDRAAYMREYRQTEQHKHWYGWYSKSERKKKFTRSAKAKYRLTEAGRKKLAEYARKYRLTDNYKKWAYAYNRQPDVMEASRIQARRYRKFKNNAE